MAQFHGLSEPDLTIVDVVPVFDSVQYGISVVTPDNSFIPVWVVSVSSSTLGETVVSTVNVSAVTGISEVLLLEMLTSHKSQNRVQCCFTHRVKAGDEQRSCPYSLQLSTLSTHGFGGVAGPLQNPQYSSQLAFAQG